MPCKVYFDGLRYHLRGKLFLPTSLAKSTRALKDDIWIFSKSGE